MVAARIAVHILRLYCLNIRNAALKSPAANAPLEPAKKHVSYAITMPIPYITLILFSLAMNS